MQALRHVEKHLGLEALYVLGTNCVDNGRREGLAKFLQAASDSPDTVLHYEFMQARARGRKRGERDSRCQSLCLLQAGKGETPAIFSLQAGLNTLPIPT